MLELGQMQGEIMQSSNGIASLHMYLLRPRSRSGVCAQWRWYGDHRGAMSNCRFRDPTDDIVHGRVLQPDVRGPGL